MLTLYCETDFVAKNQDFISLLNKITDKAFSEGSQRIKEEVKEMIDPVIQKTGEKIELGEIHQIEGEIIGSYVHNGKTGAMISLESGNKNLAREIAMQAAAMKPENEEELMGQVFIKDAEKKISDLLEEAGAKLKEMKRSSI